jgi:HSP20 family protein
MSFTLRPSLFDDSFDDLLRGFLVKPLRYTNTAAARLPLDVAEQDDAYTLRADLPGIKREDINVSIDGASVSIAAERKEQAAPGTRALLNERGYGRIARSVQLAQEVDATKAEARYNDGILELRLPKKSATAVRQLTIQ